MQQTNLEAKHDENTNISIILLKLAIILLKFMHILLKLVPRMLIDLPSDDKDADRLALESLEAHLHISAALPPAICVVQMALTNAPV